MVTERASSTTEIDERNVGNRMLQKMGWNKGEGLGAQSDGIRAPVQVCR